MGLSLFHLEPREDFVEEQEMENYLVTVMALQKLIEAERNLMVGIIPLQYQHKIFEIIIKSSMDMIVQDGEVKNYIINDNYI